MEKKAKKKTICLCSSLPHHNVNRFYTDYVQPNPSSFTTTRSLFNAFHSAPKTMNPSVQNKGRGGLLLKKLSKTKTTKKTLSFLVAVVLVFSFASANKNIRTTLKDITDFVVPRRLSQYFGNGQCNWTPPIYDVPAEIEFTKTLVAGYPSGDKRLTFVQMEGLTGLSARDEWDFAFLVSAPVAL